MALIAVRAYDLEPHGAIPLAVVTEKLHMFYSKILTLGSLMPIGGFW